MVCSEHNDRQPHELLLLQMGTASGSRDWEQRMVMLPAINSSRSTAARVLPPASASSASTSSSSSIGAKAMAHQQQQASAAAATAAGGPLRCPRCDSSNTKFCYYNNYSLSQPRHFCKACKRYWTRGGTLRNVPVGGGCRKNKRVKKQSSSSSAAAAAAAATSAGMASAQSDRLQPPPLVPPPTSADMSSFFYASSDMNLGSMPFDAIGGIGGLISTPNPSLLINTNLSHLQQPVASSYLDGDYSSLLDVPTMKQHHQSKKLEYGHSLLPYDGLQQANLGFLKDVKFEGETNLMASSSRNFSTEWGSNNDPFQAINGGGGAFGDASCLQYWNPAMGGAGGWPDAANPSIAPLI